MSLLESLLEEDLLVSELKPLKEIYFAVRTDSVNGDGSRENPFSAKSFDVLMELHRGEGIFVHLGPGVFFTQGGAASVADHPLVLLDGMRVQGAGMFNTILHLRAKEVFTGGARPLSVLSRQSGADKISNVEISDLTIDCDLRNQPNTIGREYPLMGINAINLEGNNNSIRRVRVINYGTRTPTFLNGATQNVPGIGSVECFPLWNNGPNAVVEDCIIEQPYEGSAYTSTLINCGGEKSSVRNNYLDAAYVNPKNGIPTAVTGISSDGGSPTATVTVTTRFPHNLKKDDFFELKGDTSNQYNGRWQVVSPTSLDTSSRTLQFQMPTPSGSGTGLVTIEESFPPTTRITASVSGAVMTITTPIPHWRKQGDWIVITGADIVSGVDLFNGTYQIASAPSATTFTVAVNPAEVGANQPTGELWLDRRPSSQIVRIQSIEGSEDDFWFLWGGNIFDAFVMAEATAKLIAYGPHFRKPDEWVVLGMTPPALSSKYDSYFRITEIVAGKRNEFLFEYMENNVQVAPSPTGSTSYSGAATFATHQAVACAGYAGATMERNRIIDATTGGDYHDTWADADSIVRKNYYFNVYNGVIHLVGDFQFLDPRVATVDSVGGDIVTVTTNTIFGPDYSVPLLPGMVILLTDQSLITEVDTVINVAAPQFTFNRRGVSFSAAQTVHYLVYTQQSRLIIEENIFDLSFLPIPYYDYGPPAAISLSDTSQAVWNAGFFLFKDVIVRGNLFRPKDNIPDPAGGATNTVAISVRDAARVIYDHNVATNIPIGNVISGFRLERSGAWKVFNNQKDGGAHGVVLDMSVFPPKTVAALEDEANDWLLGF